MSKTALTIHANRVKELSDNILFAVDYNMPDLLISLHRELDQLQQVLDDLIDQVYHVTETIDGATAEAGYWNKGGHFGEGGGEF